jgi:hypothetical protein
LGFCARVKFNLPLYLMLDLLFQMVRGPPSLAGCHLPALLLSPSGWAAIACWLADWLAD